MEAVLRLLRLAGLDLVAQVSTLAGGFALLAVALHLVERRVSRRLSHQFGWRSVLATGWLGVPIHEASHLLACWIFRHRIVAVSLFDPDPRTGTLGYVQHAYRRRSLYQVAGNFFIGVAPLVGGALVLLLGVRLLLPGLAVSPVPVSGNPMVQALGTAQAAVGLLGQIVSAETLGSWRFWVFALLALSVAMHIAPSRPDLQGALPGLGWVLALGFAANLANRAAGLWPPAAWVTPGTRVVAPLLATLTLALVLQGLFWGAVELLVRLLARRRRGRALGWSSA